MRIVALVLLFGASLAIRFYDLTDLPLDFHPTRQLLSAIKARALYFETQPGGIPTWKLETAIRQAKLKADVEPVVFERLVAYTYRFTGEQLWIARIYSSIFWLVGGAFLFLLLRGLVSFEGALLSTAYYLLFPYAIIGSRSFQPDPLMVMLVLLFWWICFQWTRTGSWKHALLAGLVGGFAIFIKFSAAFFVIGGALGLVLSRYTLRELLRNAQVWGMALLGIIPAGGYLIYGVFVARYLRGQFSGRFFPSLLLSPLNYVQWETKASLAAGGIFILLGLLAFFLVKDKRLRIFMSGLWGAYVVYGLIFNYHVATHDYYHLPFIPIVAVSLSPLGDWFLARLAESTFRRWMRSAVHVILIYGLLSVVWDVRNQLKSVDYRPEAAMWAEIGATLGNDARVVALTQDYGSRLEYWGWLTPRTWPSLGELSHTELRGGRVMDFDGMFDEYAGKRDYFLVTDFGELKLQKQLQERLSTHPIFAEGEGYVIYDLRN
jgi:hypothetical protein